MKSLPKVLPGDHKHLATIYRIVASKFSIGGLTLSGLIRSNFEQYRCHL